MRTPLPRLVTPSEPCLVLLTRLRHFDPVGPVVPPE
jgi:hypothetical protein